MILMTVARAVIRKNTGKKSLTLAAGAKDLRRGSGEINCPHTPFGIRTKISYQ